jgi:hypothetical protein
MVTAATVIFRIGNFPGDAPAALLSNRRLRLAKRNEQGRSSIEKKGFENTA